jgi:uncharacterized surface protein with fasciclin (FAS1) repeats
MMNANKTFLILFALLLGSVNGEFGSVAEDFFLPEDELFWGRNLQDGSFSIAPPSIAPPTPRPPTSLPPPPTPQPPSEVPPLEPTESPPTDFAPAAPSAFPPTEGPPTVPTESPPTDFAPTVAAPSESPPTNALPTEAAPFAPSAASPTPRPPSTQGLMTIAEILTGDDQFDLLVGLVEQAGLVADLEVEGPITVFAPVNSAIEDLNLPDDTDLAVIESVLLYHVASGAVALEDGLEVTTLNGATIVLTNSGGEVKVNEADITQTIAASNGIIYVIDEVLIPPTDAPAPAPTPRGRNLRA